MIEADFIAALRRLPLHPGARGLADDAAVLDAPAQIVLTHDVLVEGVHYLPDDPPATVAWKLLAVNLSDLAAKGARPLAVLTGHTLRDDDGWDATFVAGLDAALRHFAVPLLGGDTVSLPANAPRVLGLTAIGAATCPPPARSGARAGDVLWLAGEIGAAGLGLAALRAGRSEPAVAIAAYRTPRPLIAEGQALAPHAHAMMDVSDGLLIDAKRMAAASGLAVTIALDAVRWSAGVEDRLAAATAGDDYALLIAAPADAPLPSCARAIGGFATGAGLSLTDASRPVALPARLGWEHRGG